MDSYKVGFYFSGDNDPKSYMEFRTYDEAVVNLLERQAIEYQKLSDLSKSLKIGIYKDNELVGLKSLCIINDEYDIPL